MFAGGFFVMIFLVWGGVFGSAWGFWVLVLLVWFFTDTWAGGLRFLLVYG